ncbi:hypothetical protein [Halothermothrix orenii]|uniref:hypothetical protein n=1 Tax=Halothermothrix orenii TaxID=31909 RepID=UPI0002EF4A77|nr:hypothetical protein [Halothermothrix orenii]
MDYYEITVKGHLKKKRFIMFEELEVSLQSDGKTKITGRIDQPTLHAVIDHVRDLGLTLLSVKKGDKL